MNIKIMFIIIVLLGSFVVPSAFAVIQTETVSVTVLNHYPDPAKVGDVMELRVNVKNVGDMNIENVLIEIVEDFPFKVLSGESKSKETGLLPDWPIEANSETFLFKIRVNKDALDGQHDIKIKYSLNEGKDWMEESYTIDVTSKEYAEIVYIDQTKLTPGKETELTFTVHNIGNAPLYNIIFSWEEENNVVLPVNTDNTRNIKYLASNDSIKLKYNVVGSVNAEPDLYELELNLEYDLKNEEGESISEIITTKAGIFVGGETDFDIAFSDATNGETSFTIANIGSVSAYSVSISIPKQENWIISGPNSMIIGNLNKGDYTVASFSLQQSLQKNSSQNYEKNTDKKPTVESLNDILVKIAYTDTMGKRNFVEKKININLPSMSTTEVISSKRNSKIVEESFWSKYQGYIITLVVSSAVLWFYYKKKKNNIYRG